MSPPKRQPDEREAWAAHIYECAMRAGAVRRDSLPWAFLARARREQWLEIASLLGLGVAGGQPSSGVSDALYQAALDQPSPSRALQDAIGRYAVVHYRPVGMAS